MLRRFLKLGLFALLVLGVAAQTASAQNGERLREWRARQQARREAAGAARVNGAAKGQPNAGSKAGIPGPWIQKLRDMPPEQQEHFMENNERFRNLPPERQAQIRQNLERWNRLSPEQKQALIEREKVLERMTPEQRAYLRSMPPDRQQEINRRLTMLGRMSPATQQAALNDPRFMQGLSPDEQSMLRDLNSLRNPPPATQAPQP